MATKHTSGRRTAAPYAKRSQKHANTTTRRSNTTRKPARAIQTIHGPHLQRLHHLHFSATAILAIATIAAVFVSLSTSTSAVACTVSAKLVNSCRPLLGAAVNNYPQTASDTKSQTLYHEQWIGRQLDIVHTYHSIGNNSLNATDKYFASRANTYLFANWKPAAKWSDAAGGNATINAGIDQMANSVKSLGSKKIFMTIHHEAENDVSSDSTPGNSCTAATYKGSSGTTADYKAMWHNVRARFTNAGATNVVWVMDYINYPRWDCLLNDIYPGDDVVDWVMFNAYGNNTETWNGNVSHFYNFLTNNSNSQHNYVSKPWGIVEWAYHNGTSAQYVSYFNQVKTALDNNTFPNLHAYMVYDSRDQGSSTGLNSRVAYDDGGTYQNAQVAAYKAFANDPKISDGASSSPPPPAPTPTPDTTAPSVTLTAPADKATVSGAFTVSGTANDNIGVTAVTLRIDSTYVATKDSAPYDFSVNTSTLSAGNHTLLLRAWDAANNMGESRTITVTVPSAPSTGGGGGDTGGGSGGQPPAGNGGGGGTIIVAGGTPTNNTLPASGTLKIMPATPGDSIKVQVDGEAVDGTSIDTTQLTDGTHTVTVTENGNSITQKISVDNPWWTATRNKIKAHPLVYGISGVVVLAMLVVLGWLGRHYAILLIQKILMRRYLRAHYNPANFTLPHTPVH